MKPIFFNLIVLTVLNTGLSSCAPDFSDLEWPASGFGSWDYDDFTIPPIEASFYIDSIYQVDDSKLKIWARIQYDSILIIKSLKIRHSKVNGFAPPITTIIQSIPDMIDFQEFTDSTLHWSGKYEWIYRYQVQIENLKRDIDYKACIINDYSERGISRSIEQCIPIRLH